MRCILDLGRFRVGVTWLDWEPGWNSGRTYCAPWRMVTNIRIVPFFVFSWQWDWIGKL